VRYEGLLSFTRPFLLFDVVGAKKDAESDPTLHAFVESLTSSLITLELETIIIEVRCAPCYEGLLYLISTSFKPHFLAG
jgi:hypothetical protein